MDKRKEVWRRPSAVRTVGDYVVYSMGMFYAVECEWCLDEWDSPTEDGVHRSIEAHDEHGCEYWRGNCECCGVPVSWIDWP